MTAATSRTKFFSFVNSAFLMDTRASNAKHTSELEPAAASTRTSFLAGRTGFLFVKGEFKNSFCNAFTSVLRNVRLRNGDVVAIFCTGVQEPVGGAHYHRAVYFGRLSELGCDQEVQHSWRGVLVDICRVCGVFTRHFLMSKRRAKTEDWSFSCTGYSILRTAIDKTVL